MSLTSIPDPIRYQLWGRAAGRCEYEGCNCRLWLDDVTQCEFNAAYIAHIVADQPRGPRGDPELSGKLAKELSNLMLMCDFHHRLIDKVDEAGHPVARLMAMKALHEERIYTLTDIAPEKRSHVLLFGANIGEHSSPLSWDAVAGGMVPDRYPASRQPITLGLINSSFEDADEEFWKMEVAQMRNTITQQLRPRLKSGEITHLSVFALAPMPLLIQLGVLLGDIGFAEVYQRRKEPQSWKWEVEPAAFSYTIVEPEELYRRAGDAALVFALSADVVDARVTAVVGTEMPIWRVTIPAPDNDFVRSRAQTEAFRQTMRPLLDRMKAVHGEQAVIHVFPAMPASLAVDFGRVMNAKASLPLVIYDQNRKTGGFRKALEVRADATA